MCLIDSKATTAKQLRALKIGYKVYDKWTEYFDGKTVDVYYSNHPAVLAYVGTGRIGMLGEIVRASKPNKDHHRVGDEDIGFHILTKLEDAKLLHQHYLKCFIVKVAYTETTYIGTTHWFFDANDEIDCPTEVAQQMMLLEEIQVYDSK